MPLKKGTHFEISERKILLRIIDIIVAWSCLYVVSCFDFFNYFTFYQSYAINIVVLAFYILSFGTVFEIYHLRNAESRFTTAKNLLLTTFFTVAFYLFTPILTPQLPENRLQILIFFVVIYISIFIWRIAYIGLIASPRFYKRALLIGDDFNADSIKKELQIFDPNYEVVGYFSQQPQNAEKCIEFDKNNLEKLLEDYKISEIVVTNSFRGVSTELQKLLLPLLQIGYPIKSYSHVYEELTNKVPVQHIGNDFYCYFPFSRNNQNKLYLLFLRSLDITVSTLGLLSASLLLPIVLIGNLVANRGPLFYSQKRIGKNGKAFKIIKLRSMIKNAEIYGAQWATKNDMRITKFGKFLRKTRLDEIPQFINILKGDMSLIGPRPERPEFVKELAKTIPFYEIRHVIKPGVTGWAQVNAKYASSDAETIEKLQYDLYYIKHRSAFIDFRIIVKTLSTVIFFRGQ
jgi:exopolysaccharide biosynthesis polyprenyl glycosylphosphotransferase